jgi:hypothetical protein
MFKIALLRQCFSLIALQACNNLIVARTIVSYVNIPFPSGEVSLHRGKALKALKRAKKSLPKATR